MPMTKSKTTQMPTKKDTETAVCMPQKYRSKIVAPRNPKLVKYEEFEGKKTPSAYMAEMAMTTEERLRNTHEMRIPEIIELLDMSETTHQKLTMVDIEEPLFQPFPSELVFQNFEAQQSYRIPLKLRNNDQFARMVKVTQPSTPYFKIISPVDIGHKVAPGMDTVFVVEFIPDEKKDYAHELICITEREKFLVPVRAIGGRAILDFPDEIDLGTSPVKHEALKTLLVRNIGDRLARFTLHAERPFSVVPDQGVLSIGESMQIDIKFQVAKTGDYNASVTIHYDTGESVYMALFASACDANVRLDKNIIEFESTFMSKTSQRSVTLSNRSDVVAKFCWKPYATETEEEQQKQIIRQELFSDEANQKDSFLQECISDPTLRDQLCIVTRTFKHKHKILDGDKMVYDDDIIQVEPVEGEVWPNSSMDIRVLFKPVEATSYSKILFCDVTGRETRLPLRVRGDGIGAKILFSFDTLDIESVFLNSEHSYEVILCNKGQIDAIFSYVPSGSLFGQQFVFTPSSGFIQPGGYQSVQMRFSSPHLGQFVERFNWIVEGSPEEFSFMVKGCVIGPTFHFNTPRISFGSVSYGFTYKKTCKLVNTSLIAMVFSLRVPSDGVGPLASLIASSFLESEARQSITSHDPPPTEFEITPRNGLLLPQSEVEIEICFTPVSVRKYETMMTVDVEGVGDDIVTLPISAKCVVPNINVMTPILDFGKCFLDHPYERMVELQNASDLPVKFEIVAQQPSEQRSLISCSCPKPRGIIDARSVIGVPLHIQVHVVDQVEAKVCVLVYGLKHNQSNVQIYATGEGPVVHTSTHAVDFGIIPVLTDATRYIQLSNESLIPAKFNCELFRQRSTFLIEPQVGCISPESIAQLKVVARVNDSVRFEDKLSVHVQFSQTHSIALVAKGAGTTISSEPVFAPVWNIGPYFSNTMYRQKFVFKNNGRRTQQVYWMTEGFSLTRARKKQDYNSEDMKFRQLPPPPDPTMPVFRLNPDRLSLKPGQSQEVVLEGFSAIAKEVSERMVCQAIVGSSSGKEKIMVTDITATFIQPLLEFTDKELYFSFIKHPDIKLAKEAKRIGLRNVAVLPVEAMLRVEYPFELLRDSEIQNIEEKNPVTIACSELQINVAPRETCTLFVQFDPDFEKGKKCARVVSKMDVLYEDHPNTDCIDLIGEVFYPNLIFETTEIDFESVLNDTEHFMSVKVTNASPLDVVYQWGFLSHSISFEGKEEDEGIGKEISSDSEEEMSMGPGLVREFYTTDAVPAPLVSHDVVSKRRPSSAPAALSPASRKVGECSAVTWNEVHAPPIDIGISEVFDILPLYGCLKAGESQQFQVSFYGHPYIIAEAAATCCVQGGPDYELKLRGRASELRYAFSCKQLDFGLKMYDALSTQELALFNQGQVAFDFEAISADTCEDASPGIVNVFPGKGQVKAGEAVILSVRYLPGLPEKFRKLFKIRVGHFDPEEFSIEGEGIFPRVVINLPRDEQSPKYRKRYEEAVQNLTVGNGSEVSGADIEAEMDRLDMKQYALELAASCPGRTADNNANQHDRPTRKGKVKPVLQDYVLDFGHVIYGTAVVKTCHIVNSGIFPVSFIADHKNCSNTGFFVDLDRVKGLPGFPNQEKVEVSITFNTQNVDLALGPVEVAVPIRVVNGPVVSILLKAYVAMPNLELSTDVINFDEVICGRCKVVTIQIQNKQFVRCDWASYLEKEKDEVDKHIPMHLRKKMRSQKPKPKVIEMMPPMGSLLPGQKVNVQVKFMPQEQMEYSEKLFITISQSSHVHSLVCNGNGKEPALEFHTSVLKFGPILPHSGRDEVDLKVTNTCSFPIEFYSLEYDKQYLEEEKILRCVRGYDECNTILLPPRNPGEGLPLELIRAYQGEEKTKEAGTSSGGTSTPGSTGLSDVPSITAASDDVPAFRSKDEVAGAKSAVMAVGDLELTPVSVAIARYLGIDVSAEGAAARNRRGVCIIVHGAPLSGKTITCTRLAQHFDCRILSIDDVVLDALEKGTSQTSVRARELCVASAKLALANADNISHKDSDTKPDTPADNASVATSIKQNSLQVGGGRKTTIASARTGKGAASHAASTTVASPPPSFMPQPKKLHVIGCNEEEMYSCVFPDDLLVELCADRLQMSDCQMGVIFDGLQSMFASSLASAATVILRAINNRKYIYAVTLKLDMQTLKQIEAKKISEQERLAKLAEAAEKIRLQEMTEEEYDALTDAERARVDESRLVAKRDRLKKQREERERLNRDRREREDLEARMAEDERSTRKQRKAAANSKNKDVKEKKSAEKLGVAKENPIPRLSSLAEPLPQGTRPGTGLTNAPSESVEDVDRKRGGTRMGRQKSGLTKEKPLTPFEDIKEPDETPQEKQLRIRFQAFDNALGDVSAIFETWDRTTGSCFRPDSEKPDSDADVLLASTTSMAKKLDKKKAEKDQRLKGIIESPVPSTTGVDRTEQKEKIDDGIGIPNFVLNVTDPHVSSSETILGAGFLPSLDQVLDGMGMGCAGPPIPPAVIFTVVPYPVMRSAPSTEAQQRYTFVSSGPDDPNVFRDDKSKSDIQEPEKPIEKKETKKQKRDESRLSKADRQPSATVKKGRTSGGGVVPSPVQAHSPVDAESTVQEGVRSSAELCRYRWIVPAGETITLRICFQSQDLGQFDQTLNFEVVGTWRRYQLFCRGVCTFPSISREPRVVFPNRKKFRKLDEIVHKKYILNNETLEFGPLLAGKNRERYREGRYPENMEKICISNTSPMKAEVSFAYLNDPNATTFLLEPAFMCLESGESQTLTLWAYPKTPGFYEDSLVCCIKENPEPVLFKVSCHGVRPELELDKRTVQFDRVLLHRKETRSLFLRNSTLLPIAWKLSGMENLGDDFSVTVDQGVIEPRSEFCLQMNFRSMKAVNVKKVVRLEVSDAANVMGLSHAENITVLAEAYDVALDMSFPKGADGGLDFGTMRVGDEAKQMCSLKNKGRYEIAFSFSFEGGDESLNFSELFLVSPNRGSLIPSDRPTQVQVIFKSRQETTVKDVPALRCQIIEPALGEGGETIASIPIRISAVAVYSKYSIYPVNDINFGSVLVNTKKSRTFVIENKGEFDFRYTISKGNITLPPPAAAKPKAGLREGSIISGRSQLFQPGVGAQKSRRDSIKGMDGGALSGGLGPHGSVSAKLVLGMFTIFPASGVVLPGASAAVTVDMLSEVPIAAEEDFLVDISERPPADNPGGIEYRLLGESCLPSIVTLATGISSIFEEHRVVSNLNVFRYHALELEAGTGVYGEDESKFVFYNVIVGHKANARFKITNANKVPCDVLMSLKPLSNKPAHRIADVFDIDQSRTSIPAHSFVYATVTFQPPSMQQYQAIFEIIVDGGALGGSAKSRSVSFEIYGDGNLPRLAVQKPLTTNVKGSPIMIFNRLLVGRSQIAPLLLKNDGTLPCKVALTLMDPHSAFTISRSSDATGDKLDCDGAEDSRFVLRTSSSKPASANFLLAIGDELQFLVEFAPQSVAKIAADVRLSVQDNPFEDVTVHMVGEGYLDLFTIDNIHGGNVPSCDTFAIDDCDIRAAVDNRLFFGDCMINVPQAASFTVTNHSAEDTMRFQWESHPEIAFSPFVGHLKPKCAKDVAVTFLASRPCKMVDFILTCKVARINLQTENAKDWDSRRRVVKWIDVARVPSASLLLNTEGKTSQGGCQKPPVKKKVVEMEAEPAFATVPGSETSLQLLVSATAGYGKWECNTDRIYFKDTFMFQTRVYSFKLKNTGDVQFQYQWNIQPGLYLPPAGIQDCDARSAMESRSGKSQKKTTPGIKPSYLSAPSRQSTSANLKNKLQGSSSKHESTQHEKTSPVGEGDRTATRQASVDSRPPSLMFLASEAGALYSEAPKIDDFPFTIEPCSGIIKAGEEGVFTVKFSPVDLLDSNVVLTASIPNLEAGAEGPIIAVHGLSLLPWCHFELGESNYISERRNPEMRGPNGAPAGSMLDPQTKVIEFEARGIKTKVSRKFFILNPTDTSYAFSWQPESGTGLHAHPSDCDFTCLTPKGTIAPGKKTEIAFEYSVSCLDVVESFWRFFIANHNVSVPFLLVGFGQEPAVSFDRSHINFRELLLGHTATATVYLLNDEDLPFHFSFDDASRHAAGYAASIDIDQMKGVIPAKDRLPVVISYKAVSEAEVNFSVICRVKKMTKPLTLNVKADGFTVNVVLVCEDSNGNKVNLTDKGVNQINFGQVEVNEKSVRQLYIENNGRFNIDFTWSLSGPSKPKGRDDAWTDSTSPISMVPESGNVVPNSRRRCQLSFCPPCKLNLRNCVMELKIVNGPTYQLAIAGRGVPPALHLSFTTYDFGPCFLYRPGLPIQKATLVVKNVDTKDISLECQYVSTKHLEILSSPDMIQASESKEMQILFYPRELKKYHERIPFEVNGLSFMYVDIYGEGTEMDIRVENLADRKVQLGALQVGQKVNQPVRILNNSLAAIDYVLALTPSMPLLQDSSLFSVSPATLIHMKPKSTFDVIVHFHPKCRVPKFSEEVIFECAGISQPLFTVTGCCHGLDIRLDSEAIPFGTVTLGSSTSRKLMLSNMGDIGSSFVWNVERFKPAFSIHPPKGYISPGMEVPFEITFTPNAVSQDIRYEDLKCVIEGGKPLKLVLTGSCVAQLPMKEVVFFQTYVRNRDSRSVTLHNKSNQLWTLKPVIDGEYWTGADTFLVEPQQSKNYELLYRPLTMTQDSKKHSGSVFFALPDGTGLLYSLLGQADPPKPVANIQRDVPCKTTFVETLAVTNWLRKPQRFRVTIDLVKPEKPDLATSFKGLDYVDVPGMSKKDYKVQFFAHKEGAFSAKVTFRNDASGEYQFYYLSFKATAPGTIATIELTTPVRQSASHAVTINNPLPAMVNFQISCNVQDVNVPPQFTVPSQSEGCLTFEYLPLKFGSSAGRLTMQSVELGSYIYDLNLTATPAALERAVHFMANLGGSQTLPCRFLHYAKARVEYSCKVDNADFSVEKTINAASASSGGSEVAVDVSFEPSRLGDVKTVLTLSSPIGGDYTFPLFGHCLPPKPQGPYTIKAGSSTQIPFKNIFSQTTSFLFHTDNPCFTVKSGEAIRAKKTHNIVVGFDGNQGDSKAVRMGRLVVTCARTAGIGSNVTWTFYLKGVTV